MAQRQIIWTPRAAHEIKNILTFYKDRNGNSKYSKWLFAKIQKRIKLLRRFPGIGYSGKNDIARILPILHFGIIYEIMEKEIIILSIWDFHQDPKKRVDKI